MYKYTMCRGRNDACKHEKILDFPGNQDNGN